MGYKLLGYIVWRGGRWYLARRYPGAPRKLAIGGGLVAAAGVAAAVAVGRSRSS